MRFHVSTCFVIVAALASGATCPLNAQSPNIILIVADDLGVNDLACYGRQDHKSPNLDQLSKQGMRFTCAYAAQSICSASRAALMTGKCPARLHLTNYLPGRPDAPSQKLLQPIIEGQLPLEEPTIAEWLQGVGYTTGIFGKWHLGGKGFGPGKQGFDIVIDAPSNSEPSAQEGGKSEYALARAAMDFMTDHQESPFFCYVAHYTPHIPLSAKAELIESNSETFLPTYAAMVETLDDTVGMLMRHVEELGIQDRTIFIFTSDNGGLHVPEGGIPPATHNSPFRAGKGYLYEGGLREPLIVRWPGHTQAGSECATPVLLTDLVPTLLEAAGIDVPGTVGPLDGMSLTGVLAGHALPERDLYWHFPNYTNQGGRPAGAIRVGDWKLVESFEDGSLELFNLAADPGEVLNLALSESGRAQEMLQRLEAWRERVGAQMPLPNADFDEELHRKIYGEQDASQLRPAPTGAEMLAAWVEWRAGLSAATRGRRPRVTPPEGDIRLQAQNATVHGEMLRYEPQSNKNVLGYWTVANDWAEWEFAVTKAGEYEIEIQQGAGRGSGGAVVEMEITSSTTEPQRLQFTVIDTGHFQNMILRTVGSVQLKEGSCRLAVKPQSKPGVAVMDLRRVVLRPLDSEAN